MDLHEAEQLLEKYWQCETSVEDEQKLRDFFAAGKIPSSLKGTSELFMFSHRQIAHVGVFSRAMLHGQKANETF